MKLTKSPARGFSEKKLRKSLIGLIFVKETFGKNWKVRENSSRESIHLPLFREKYVRKKLISWLEFEVSSTEKELSSLNSERWFNIYIQ
tara:strand:+ start:358 stop:624 length:267 start_codon:yes stop_codon:yes gene_type:complete